MKADKELLELAGKAANIPPRVIGAAGGLYNCDELGWHYQWNPLTNDGDALRLANTLEIDIEFHVNVEAISWIEGRHVSEERGLSMSATRRAIVRAAAAIGEQMP